MMRDPKDVPPPGSGSSDSTDPDLDAIGFALSRLRCYLLWIGAHHHEYLQQRNVDEKLAEQELLYLEDSIRQAKRHFVRLSELLLAGYTFDPTKKNPMLDRSDDDFWRRQFGEPEPPFKRPQSREGPRQEDADGFGAA